jgi:DNA-binding response OmpR family regulator
MDKKRILVVDDEQDLCEILLFNLMAAGFEADAAFSAEEALQKDLSGYDLLLLDVMMPGMSGFELARRLKGDGITARLPIIFLTAKDSEDDTLRGFELGADDYIAKPFSVREVMARVRAVLSRSASAFMAEECLLCYEGLSVDDASKRVTVEGVEIALTKTEHELLRLLLKHRGQVLSRQQLLEGAWPQDVVVTDRTVDVNIARLRKKLGTYAANIVARQGFDYCFIDGKNE